MEKIRTYSIRQQELDIGDQSFGFIMLSESYRQLHSGKITLLKYLKEIDKIRKDKYEHHTKMDLDDLIIWENEGRKLKGKQ